MEDTAMQRRLRPFDGFFNSLINSRASPQAAL